jgi:hypothetical protein
VARVPCSALLSKIEVLLWIAASLPLGGAEHILIASHFGPDRLTGMSLSKLFNVRSGVALAAACAALTASPSDARADHRQVGAGGLLLMTLAHTQLIPAYLSTGYYAYASSEPMPAAWTTMNIITGTAAGSVGVAMMGLAVEVGDLDHGPGRANNTEVIMGVFGGLTLAAGITVSVLSILQATRSPDGDLKKKDPPKKAPKKEPEKVTWSVVPSASVAKDGSPSGSLTLIGTF